MVTELSSDVNVNVFTIGDQDTVKTAALVGGGYVSVWQSANQNGSGDGITAQIYNEFGQRVGTPFFIEENTAGDQTIGSVAATSDGGFVVTWDGPGSTDIIARKFDSSGTPEGAEFQVNTETYSTQNEPTVTGLNGGGFVVTWSSFNNESNTWDIRAQRYDNSATAQGPEFTINSTTAGQQQDSAVSSLADGGFVVTWTDQNGLDGNLWGVFAQRFDASGNPQGSEIPVNTTTTSYQYESDVYGLTGGGFVVVWRDDNGDGSSSRVAAQVFDATGTPIGTEIQLNTSTLGAQYTPSVTATPDGGFFVAWYSDYTGSNATYDIIGRHYDATGTAVTGEIVVSDDGANFYPQRPDVTALPNGLIIVSWDYPPADGDGSGRGVVQHLFELPGSNIPLPPQPTLEAVDSMVTFTETDLQSAPQLLDSTGVAVSGASDFDGGRLIVKRITSDATDTEYTHVASQFEDALGVRDQGTGVGQIGVSGTDVTFGGVVIGTIVSDGGPGTPLEIAFNANATPAVVEAVVENLTYANDSDDPANLVKLAIFLEDGNGASAVPSVIDVHVVPEVDAPQPVGPSGWQVNSYTNSTQDQPTVTALPDGGWVVLWRSYGQDTISSNTYAIVGQRFDASGAPVGAEFIVNTQVAGNQDMPDVAGFTAGSLNGGWVATWYDPNNASEGYVRAQLFDSSGAKVGGEIMVPTTVYSTQWQPSVETFSDGSFAIAWSQYRLATNTYDIAVQRFDDTGAKVGGEIIANTFTTHEQSTPQIAELAGGGFAVTWRSYEQGVTNSYEIKSRVFDATGTPVTAETQVNSVTAGTQEEPVIAGLNGGGYVIAWTDQNALDGSLWGVFAQIFDATGTPVGDMFLVNEYTTNYQWEPSITALNNGGFAISYTANQPGLAQYDVMIQHYDASGNRIDSEILVNQVTAGSQEQSDIATLANGDVIVVWTDMNGRDGNGHGIFQRVVGDSANYADPEDNPVVTITETNISFDEAVVNAGPELLFPGADVNDLDSADLDGGVLSIYRIDLALNENLFPGPDNAEQDNLGIRDQGAGAGQIGVSGGNVTFGGVVIGTIASSGADGSGLVINLNSNSTPEAVEALLQNVTYSNDSDDPAASRTYRIVLTDGDGGTSQPINVKVTVVPELDGAVANGDEQQVNSFEQSTQHISAITELDGGGYVVIWRSYDQDVSANNYGIFGQLFASDGTPVGDEFQVNTLTAGNQNDPAVAPIALADGGGFVVVWQDANNGAGYIKAQIYNADGTTRGGEFMVETEIYSTQSVPAVAQVPGGFTVVWSSTNDETFTADIRGQKFDGNGAMVGSEFTVNTTTASTQTDPDIASDSAGNSVVVWEDHSGQDSSGQGIFAQRYDAAGNAVGTEFQVNSFTSGTQSTPSVAYLTDGRFVIAWEDTNARDSSGWAVFGQLFQADGTPIGGEFLVNDLLSGSQYQPDVIGLYDGGFAVAFYSDGGQDGNSGGVFVQQFNADGSRRDGALLINEETTNNQHQGVITQLQHGANTGFAASWTSATQDPAGDGSSDGIFTRVFGPDGGMVPTNASPDLEGVAQIVDFAVATIGTPMIIDNAFDLTDMDSANFDGGSVEVRFLDFQANTDDQLSIISGKGISVSGSDVLYDGVIIGTVDATDNGVNGADLVINLNANSTAENTRYLLEQIGYSSSAPVANTDRSVSVRVTDGDGGKSEGRGIRIDIENTATPPVISLTDLDDATYTETQVAAGRRLDMSVDFDYTGAAGFDGGTVELEFRNSITSRSGGQHETLSVANIGTGTNQISVAGTDVSFEGVIIGTIDAIDDGQNGANLTINLNAAATQAGVDALIEAFTYQNTSGSPASIVRFRVDVTANGGTSTGNRDFDISITSQAGGGPQPLGDEEQVNAHVPSTQRYSEIAELADGGFVVTWESLNQDSTNGNDYGIYQQRYDAEGTPVGPETLVNSTTNGGQTNSTVAGLSTGGWVTVWEAAGDGSGTGIFAAITDVNGVVGPQFQINFQTSATQWLPDVTALSNGNFVVVWQSDTSAGAGDGNSTGVIGRIFDSAGNAVSPGDIVLNTTVTGAQDLVEVAANGSGGFVAVWTSPNFDGNSDGIVAQRFDAAGNMVGGEIPVNTTTAAAQQRPGITELADGGFVVVWESPDGSADGVFMQRFDAGGTPVGGEIQVNDWTGSTQDNAKVAATSDGGWVVTWRTNAGINGNDVLAQRYDASGNRVDGNFYVNDETAGTQLYATVTGLSTGRFAATWTSSTSAPAGDGNGDGIFVRLFGDASTDMQSGDPTVGGLIDVTLDEAAVNAGYVEVFGSGVAISDLDSSDFDGGRLLIHIIRDYEAAQQFRSPDNFDQDQMTFQGTGILISGGNVSVGGVVIGTIVSDGQNGSGLEVLLNGNATPERVEDLLGSLHYSNASNDPRDSRTIEVTVTDGDGGQSGHDTFDLMITPEQDGVGSVGPEVQVNTNISSNQYLSSVSGLAGGGHVVVWASRYQDNPGENDYGVFAQRFDVDGQPIGPEFQVNTTFANSQTRPNVVGLADGSFVVGWQGNGVGDTGGVFAQRFDANGNMIGNEFRLNDATAHTQSQASLAAIPTGGFIATWEGGSGNDVYARIFDASGAATGIEFIVNSVTPSTQQEPAVAALTGGGFAVVWRDHSTTDVKLQVLDASGGAVGVETLVNTNHQPGTQYQPDVAALSNGGFVVVWRDDNGTDGSANAVYAQTYNAGGTPTGDPFLVNEFTSGSQYEPAVAGLPTGGFVVAFRDNSGLDGSGNGVFAQQFDNAGNRIDGQFQVNTENASTQEQPAIAALQNGAFVVSYTSSTNLTAGDGDQEGVFSQIFGDPSDFNLEGRPVIQGVNESVTYLENTLNVGPQLIDANNAAAVTDSDSADFDGGFLRVDVVIASRGYQDQVAPPDNYTQDNISLRQAQGITVSGNTVSVNGTAVGTIANAGTAGDPFEITLNANATPDIVELLVENLTYRNTSDDPEPSRVLRIQVGDGDGGVSDPTLVTVNITAQVDGAAPVFGERQANTETTNQQEHSYVARLDDGGFVIVWQSWSQDAASTWGVYGQRFDANGNPVDGEFKVNTTDTGNQYEAAVTGLDTGGWVVVWRDDESTADIHMQRYNSDGTPAGTETVVNSFTTSTQYAPDVTVLANGDYLVTWASFNHTGLGGSSYDVNGQIFQSDGIPVGIEFRVNTEVPSNQEFPAVTALPTGGFVVAWNSANSAPAGDGSSNGVFYQVFDNSAASYAAIGTEMQANTYTPGHQDAQAIAALTGGGWVTVWRSSGQDGSSNGVFGQRYDASGNPVGQEFRVNDVRINSQFEPEVAALSNGGFAVVFTDNNGTDGSGHGVFVQQYDANGNRIDSALQVNTEFSSTQDQPSIAALDDGGFVVSWTSVTSGTAGDGSSRGVFYQVFGNTLPVVTDVNASTAEDTNLVFDAQIFEDGYSDAEGQLLAEIRIDVLPSIGTLEFNSSPVVPGQVITVAQLNAGALVYMPPADFNGSADFGWTGSDGNAFASTGAQTFIDVTPVNDPVGLNPIPDQTISEGSFLSLPINLNDPDNDTWTVTTDYDEGNAPAVFNTTSNTPSLTNFYENEGTYTVSVTVTDNNGSTENETFSVTVENAAPNAGNDHYNTDEDTNVSGVNLFNDDSDPGGDPFTVTQVNGGAYTSGTTLVLPSGATISISATGELVYDPTTSATLQALASGQNANDSFTYTITDDGGLSDTATVFLNISGLDDNVSAQDDIFTIDEDNTLNGNVFDDNGNGADIDPEGDTLTVVSVDGSGTNVGAPWVKPGGGILTVESDGTISFAAGGFYEELGVGATRDITFTYVVEEGGSNLTASANGTITITGVNDDPNADDDGASTLLNTPVTISVLSGDFDVDQGDTLTVTSAVAPANGSVVINPDGTITYTPNTGFSGTDTFTYDVIDGNGGSDTATVTVNVAGNNAPDARHDAFNVAASGTVAGNLFDDNGSGVDSDAEGDPFSITLVNGAGPIGSQFALPSGALLTINGNGTFDYDPNGQFTAVALGSNGFDSFTYTIEDSAGGTDTATVSLTIAGENEAPTMANGTGNAMEDGAAVSISLAALGDDVDNDDSGSTLAYAVTSNPSEGSASVSGTNLEFDPGADFQDLAMGETRDVTVGVTATDGHGATSNEGDVVVTVTGVNDDPTLGGGLMNAMEDGPAVTLDLSTLGDDIDSDDDGSTLTYSIVTPPSDGGASITGNDLEFDPLGDFQGLAMGETQDVTVQIQATDAHGATSTIEDVVVTVTGVNDDPTLGGGLMNAMEDGPAVTLDLTTLGDDVDSDDDSTSLNYAIVTAPGEGGASITGNTLEFDPLGDFQDLAVGETRDVTVQIQATDSHLATSTVEDVTVTVTGVNDNPTLGGGLMNAMEDGPVVTLDLSTLGDDVDSDNDGSSLSYAIITNPGEGSASIIGATLSFDPGAGFQDLAVGETRDVTVQIQATDDHGANSTIEDVVVTVMGVNDDPDAMDDAASTAEDTAVTISVLTNDSDVDASDVLSVSGASNGANGTTAVNPDGTITYTPNAGFSGTDTFTYTISDGNGGTDTATVTVNVSDNASPIAQDDEVATDASVLLSGDVFLDNGNGVDSDPEGNPFTVTQVNGTGNVGTQIALASGALLTLSANGTFDYDPNGAFAGLAMGNTGTDSFTYTIQDSFGGTDTATVTVSITGENEAPTMGNGTGNAMEDGAAVSIDLAALGDDVDSDDDGSTLTYAVTTNPSEGSALVSGTNLEFNPGAGFQGLAMGETQDVTVGVTATDSHGASSNEGDIVVTVTGVNDDPTLGGGLMNAMEDGPSVTLDLSTLGDDVDSDDDGSSLTYSIITAPGEGSASITGNSLEFDPLADFQDLAMGETRDVTVQIQATDSHLATSTVEDVTVTVTGVNDDPTLGGGLMNAMEDGPAVTLDLSTLGDDVDSDDDGSSLTYSIITAPVEGSASITGNTLEFDPGAAFQDLDTGETRDVTIQIQATDAHGATSTIEDVVVTVTGVNDAPVFTSGTSFAIDENTTAVTTVTATDVDVETLTFGISGGADELLFNIDPTTGALSFNAAPDFEAPTDADPDGIYEVEVSVTDGDAVTTQLIDVTVNDVDEGGGPNIVTGTSGIDYLVGTADDDIIQAMGGRLDNLRGLGGADTFEFTNIAGSRDQMRVLDYEVGIDSIDLGGEAILSTRDLGSMVFVFLDNADRDAILVMGTGSASDIDFI